MKVLSYSASENNTTISIIKRVQSLVAPEHFVHFRCLDEVEIALRRQNSHCKLALFGIEANDEIDHLIRMKHLLEDIRVILILSNSDDDTITKGHRLYPRFMTDSRIDIDQLTSVIEKNLEHIGLIPLKAGNEKLCYAHASVARKKGSQR